MQNLDTWETYAAAIGRGELPLGRAYRPTPDERLIREVILQLKRGSIQPGYFAAKFGVDVLARFDDAWQSLSRDGYLAEATGDRIALTREGCCASIRCCSDSFCPSMWGVRVHLVERSVHDVPELNTTPSSSAAARADRPSARCWPSTAIACCCSSASRFRATTSASR